MVPILAGGRLSGKVHGFNVGLLDMQTRSLEGVAPANNFGVVRLGRDLPNRSGVGAIFVNRQGTGDAARRRATTTGPTASTAAWGIGRYGQVSGYAGEDLDARHHARRPRVQPRRQLPLALLGHLRRSSPRSARASTPRSGFLARQGYRKPEGLVFHVRRMNGWLGLHEIRPHVSYRGFWKPDGFQESGFLHLDSHLEWRSGYEVHTGVNLTREGLREPFEIYPGVVVPPGTYDHSEVQLVFITNPGAPP